MPPAIVPWSRLPKVRRLPPVSMWRSIQTSAVPSSAANKRVIGGVLVDDLGEVGAGNGVRAGDGFGLRRLHILPMPLNMGRQERVVLVLLKARQQGLQGRLDIADRPDRHRMPPPDMRRDARRSEGSSPCSDRTEARRNPRRAAAARRSRERRDSPPPRRSCRSCRHCRGCRIRRSPCRGTCAPSAPSGAPPWRPPRHARRRSRRRRRS